MTTATTAPHAAGPVAALRRLYVSRAAFAVVWALVVFAADGLSPLSRALLVLYPLVDLAAAVVDVRGSRTPELWLNVAVSGAAAVGVAIAGASGIPAVLRVWGVWAVVAGLIQLVVAVRRRALGGQWPMIAAGGLSVVAGASFVAAASGHDPKLGSVAGYAVLGGIFFLASALGLGRAMRTDRSPA